MRIFFTLSLLALLPCAFAQSPPLARVCVIDGQHRPVVGAALYRSSAFQAEGLVEVLASTGVDGCTSFSSHTGTTDKLPDGKTATWAAQIIIAQVDGFAHASVDEPASGQTATIVLRPEAVPQSITVVADRGLIDETSSATLYSSLTQQQLAQAPGLSLDDRLHRVAGFTLFRRTSSWSANPTTEGVSLRGLGSTAASRTLVVSDQVPQNDPFGGWIHWDEIPALAIAGVAVVRAGSSNLYGSSAIGGVIDILPAPPAPTSPQVFIATGITGGHPQLEVRDKAAPNIVRLNADASGATENSANGDALLTTETHYGLGLGAFSLFRTGGYIPTAPALRGTVDIPSNVSGESARAELRPPTWRWGDTAFLRGNLLNESRSNGTPLQTNANRLWRYQAGADGRTVHYTAAARLFGSREDYRQSFSSIAANRDSETLTKLQRVPTDELGFSLLAARKFYKDTTLAAGLDARDIRATDNELSTTVTPNVNTSTSARQREVGGFLNGLWDPGRWLLSGSIRVDSFRTFDARQITSKSPTVSSLPEIDELVASPHLAIGRDLGRGVFLTAGAFRAFRGPSMNELYRTGQVGQQTTLANNSLLAERATGFESTISLPASLLAGLSTLRVTYFWTEVNRPISAVLLSQSATTQTLQRQNLGQIRSRGAEANLQSPQWHGFDAQLGYQLAFATVTAFNSSSPAQANLHGKWIPEVPRESVTAQTNYLRPRFANFHLIASYTGEAFDDSSNQFILHPYARFDFSADRDLKHGLSLFAGAQNLLNRSIDAGRTPILTLAAPRLVQAGLRYNLAR
jgi:outer membrane receptor protein involved in Fe transport